MNYFHCSLALDKQLDNLDIEKRFDLLLDILESLESLSSLQICHGNIKPSNILFGDDGHYYLSDCCKNMLYIENNCPIILPEGSLYEFMSPEMLKGESYDTACDVWSFGCIVYYMFSGVSPYDGDTRDEVVANIFDNNYDKLDCDSTGDLTNFLSKILIIDKNKRLTIDEIKNELEILSTTLVFLTPSTIRKTSSKKKRLNQCIIILFNSNVKY